MVTALVLFIVLDVDTFAALFFLLIVADVFILLVVVLRLQSALRLEILLLACASLRTESSSGLSHLVKQVVTAAGFALASWLGVVVVVEDLFVFSAFLVHLQVLDDFLVLLLALDLLQIILIKFVFEIVNVREFLNIDSVESF